MKSLNPDTRPKKFVVAKIIVIAAAIPILLWAYAAGPDPGKSGVPGESTCAEAGCHTGTALNGGGGSVAVTFPGGSSYVPGVKQHLKVTITDSSARLGGFELTARTASDAKTQAGSFTSTDQFTAVVCSSFAGLSNPGQWTFLNSGQDQNCPASRPLSYIEHTLSGSQRRVTGSQTYEFDWTPPASAVGDIVIYVAGNAANGDGNNTGDHIYTKTYTLTAASGGATPAISRVRSAGDFGGFSTIAPGTWVEITGSNFSSKTREWAGADFSGVNAPTSLDGVKVTIGGKSAFVNYISPTQVNAQIPSDAPTGEQQLTVTNSGGTSAAYNITVNATQAGVLGSHPAFLIGGKQYVVAQVEGSTFVLPPGSIAGITSRQAKPGETIVIYGIGFGPSALASGQVLPAGQIVSALNSIAGSLKVQIGGVDAKVDYAGLAVNFVGLYQFNIVVPSVPDGDAVPVTFALNGQNVPQTMVTAIKR